MLAGKVLQFQFSICGFTLMASCMKSYVSCLVGAMGLAQTEHPAIAVPVWLMKS